MEVTMHSDPVPRLCRLCRPLWVAILAIAALLVVTTRPAPAEPRALVELFTSQGCSSCPPADRVLGDLANDPSIIAITWPIDYWDYLGWKDTLADPRFAVRQRAYSQARGDREVYTPQAVVNGLAHTNGGDRAAMDRAIAETSRKINVMSQEVNASLRGREISVTVSVPVAAATRSLVAPRGEVWICPIAKSVSVSITRGENSGLVVVYHNVVRDLVKVADWNGGPDSWDVPLEKVAGEGVDGAVIFIQSGGQSGPGAILGATYIRLR